MQQMTIAGRIGSDAVLRTTQGGDKVASFNVAVDYRDGRDKKTNWYRVSLWGKRADALQPYLLKGSSVTVAGEFSLSEYEGKQQLNLRASEIALQGGRGGGQQQSGSGGGGGLSANRQDDLDDDFIPFVRSDGIF